MMRYFATKASPGLANEMRKATNDIRKKLGVNSLEDLKLADQPKPGDINTVSTEEFNSVFKKVSREAINANAEVAEEAMRNSPYY